MGCLLASMAAAGDVSGQEQALDAQLRGEEASLRPQRLAFQGYFREAYARYPAIPAGTLEAIAFVQSRWLHLQPGSAQAQGHLHMPVAHGVMGLYAGGGFADQVGEAARLLGVPAEQIKRNPRLNVFAAAALLDREIRKDSGLAVRPTSEAIRPALARYAGFSPSPHKSQVEDYARSSFAFDVLLAQDRGINDRGIVVPERAIAWERAFAPQQLIALRAPLVRLDVTRDRIETANYTLDPSSETLVAKAPRPVRAAPGGTLAQPATDVGILSTDYGPALWVASPYYHARSSYSSVTIHTAQGSYAGTISWFRSNPYSVSAHYVIRSSDGQVTQMVRNANAAHHVGAHNGTTLGIEHEGYVNNSSWYTTAMYNSSAALVRSFCAKYSAISCANAYNGPAHSGVVVLPTAVDVKGHQHYSSQDHTDPGINWNWRHYYTLLNPSSGTTNILDTFESSVGHFTTGPAYSGSTTGIAATSSATRDCSIRKGGSCSLRVLLKDNTASSAAWSVRLLSGAGNPGSNTALTRANGQVGFWVYAAGSGISVGLGIDDSDGTERSTSKALAANTWTWVSWSLTDAAQWNAWVNGNGAITASSVKLDAIWLYRAQTAYDVNVYIDDVRASH